MKNDPFMVSYTPGWSKKTIPREPQTTMKVWVTLGCLFVAVIGAGVVGDLSKPNPASMKEIAR